MSDLLSLLGGRVELASLPASRAYAHQDRASIDEAAGRLTGIKRVPATPEPTAAADAGPTDATLLQRFRQTLAKVENEAGREILSPAERAATEADPAEVREWLTKHDAAQALKKKQDEAAEAAAKEAAEKATANARARRVDSGMLAVLEARGRR